MNLTLCTVGPQFIEYAWSDGAYRLGEVVQSDGTGECTAEQLKGRLLRQECALLAAVDSHRVPHGWVAVEWLNFPNMRVLHVYAIHAPGATLPNVFDQLCDYARDGGAKAIQGACSEAVLRLWQRKFGFTEVYRIARRML